MDVAFLPVYPNPYQKLLRDALQLERIGVEFLDNLPPEEWLRSQRHRLDILHYHWLDGLYMRRYQTPLQVMKFIRHFHTARSLGYRTVWTAHNILPHRPVFLPLHKRIRRLMMAEADAVITHCEYGRRELLARFPRHGPVVVIPHGHYRDVYPRAFSRASARERLGLEESSFIYLSFGNITAYKGLGDFVHAFRRVAGPRDIALIVGRDRDRRLVFRLSEISARDDRIHIKPGFVPEEEVALYHAAADVLVAPFRQVLTSGSVIAALSFGVPVIAPALGCLPELISPAAGLLYEVDKPAALDSAIRDIKARDQTEMRAAARQIADGLDWRAIARRTAGVYQSCLATS